MRQILQNRLRFPKPHDVFRPGIAVFADERVDFLLFAEAFQARRDNEEFAAVGHRHPRAVNRLVRDPSRVELVALHHRDDFLERRRDRNVLTARRFSRFEINVQLVSDVNAGMAEVSVFVVSHRNFEVEVRQEAEQLVFRFVVAAAKRRQEVAEVVLDPAAGRHHVRRADRRFPAEADEVVFVVVREAENFVRNDVPNVDNEIPLFLNERRVQRDWNRPIRLAVRNFLDVTRRNFAD